MTLFGGTLATVNMIAERLLIQKVAPTVFDTVEVWVNSATGNDQGQGRGAEGSPFQSIPQALKSAANVGGQESLIIHLQNAGPHILPEGYVFPSVNNSDNVALDFAAAFGFVQSAPVTIRATPVLQLTITAAQILSQIPDAVSGLIPIVVSIALVPGAHAGRYIVDSFGTSARIDRNTANTLFVAINAPMTGPLSIYTEGATIAPANAGAFVPTVQIRGGSAPVVFQGVTITPTANGSLGVSQGAQVVCQGCNVPSLILGAAPNVAVGSVASVEMAASVCEVMQLFQGSLVLQNSLLVTLNVLVATPAAIVGTFSVIAEKPAKGLFFDGTTSPGYWYGANLDIMNADINGLFQSAGELNLSNVKISTSAQVGAVVQKNATGRLFTLGGSGNLTGGLQVNHGANLQTNAATNINAGGVAELKVGSNAAVTWAAFHPVKNNFDITAITGQLARLWEA